jgi:hypothetical protein
MKMDRDVEPLVRAAIGHCIAGDQAQYFSVLDTLSEDNKAAKVALLQVFAINSTALLLFHKGELPDQEWLRMLAGECVRAQTCTAIDETTVLELWTAVTSLDNPSLAALELEDIVLTGFTAAAWLLSSFLGESDIKWSELLDAIEGHLESVPG